MTIRHVTLPVQAGAAISCANTLKLGTLQKPRTGENQEVHRSGDLTGSVVITSLYSTIQLHNVTLMETTRVVTVHISENVVTQLSTVLVGTVQITELYTRTGENQEVHRSGDL